MGASVGGPLLSSTIAANAGLKGGTRSTATRSIFNLSAKSKLEVEMRMMLKPFQRSAAEMAIPGCLPAQFSASTERGERGENPQRSGFEPRTFVQEPPLLPGRRLSASLTQHKIRRKGHSAIKRKDSNPPGSEPPC